MSEAPKKKGLSFPGAKAKVTIVKPGELRGVPAPITSERPAAAVPAALVAEAPKPPVFVVRPKIAPGSGRIFGKKAETPGAPIVVSKPPAAVPPPKLPTVVPPPKPKAVAFRNEPEVKLFTPVTPAPKPVVTKAKPKKEEPDAALVLVKGYFDSLMQDEDPALDDYKDINLDRLLSEEPEEDGRFKAPFLDEINEDFTYLNELLKMIEFVTDGFLVDKSDEDALNDDLELLYLMFEELDKEEEEEEAKPAVPAATTNLSRLLDNDKLGDLADNILREEGRHPEDSYESRYSSKYQVDPLPEGYRPQNRRSFTNFIYETFKPFELPKLPAMADPNACMSVLQSDRSEMYLYQQFIREYMSWQTPYRGILVYHGLGSGKTCTSIAAAEALFATFSSPKQKIIVMTPRSLRQNFIGEITTCGFQHFRFKNHWSKHSLSDPLVKLFAKSVMQIPQQYLDRVSYVWIPDFTREQNYQAPADASAEEKAKYLTANQQSEVREQITNILVYDPKEKLYGRIWFISYNGFTKKSLMKIACLEPEKFDNSVIIIDEIHNMARIMQGTIEPYITLLPGAQAKRKMEFEPITWEKWSPKLCPASWDEYNTNKELQKKMYKRGYLFYRLLTQATNSKIIGLSGTPLINFPEELAILSNLLHGYSHIIEGNIKKEGVDAKDAATIDKIKKVLDSNLYTDFQSIRKMDKVIQLRTTFLPEGIQKVPGSAGVKRVAPGEPVLSFAERLASLQSEFEAEGVNLITTKGQPFAFTINTEPLLPPTHAEFEETFIDPTDNVKINNEIVLIKRLTGLISYYKGSRKDLMPEIRTDASVFVPMSEYQQVQYSKARLEEINIEEQKEKRKKETGSTEATGRLAALFAEVYEIKNLPQSSNYRMASRQSCNFAFPAEVHRPRPANKKEELAELGKDVADIIDTDGAEAAEDLGLGRAREEEEEDEEEDEGEGEQAGGAAATVVAAGDKAEKDLTPEEKLCRAIRLPGETYAEQITRAKTCLATLAQSKLKIGPTGLGETSPKFQKMLENIAAAQGSSLVYSQFLQMEGIGIFCLAMDANGYEPIEIKFNWQTKQAFFSEKTKASLAKGPSPDPATGIKQLRYIKFTGEDEDIVRRYALLLFNGRFSELPRELNKSLTDAGWTGNDKGDLCRVFCITSAGAEGLSLKNVRAVHIMEPYWNDVRTSQVKGRAVRICSHAELPPEDRNVDIFTYISVFSPEAQLAKAGSMQIAEKIVNRDSLSREESLKIKLPIPATAQQYTLTSDQRLWLISNRKKALIDNLQRVMKSAAVDCRLNYEENKEEDPEKAFTCKKFAYDSVGDFMYDPNLRLDIEETRKFVQVKKPTTVAAAAVAPAAITPAAPAAPKKKLKATIQEVTYWLEPEVDAEGKTIKFYLYDESDKDLVERKGEVKATESKKNPGSYVPVGSTLQKY